MGRELILSVSKKDLEIHYYSGTGAGGQHRNKHQNCVRMRHPDSGAKATGTGSKSRQSNLKEAFKTLIQSPEFESWRKREVSQRLFRGISIKEEIARQMRPENLKIEAYTP